MGIADLPDINEEDWNAYTADQFLATTNPLLDSLRFQQTTANAGDRILAELQQAQAEEDERRRRAMLQMQQAEQAAQMRAAQTRAETQFASQPYDDLRQMMQAPDTNQVSPGPSPLSQPIQGSQNGLNGPGQPIGPVRPPPNGDPNWFSSAGRGLSDWAQQQRDNGFSSNPIGTAATGAAQGLAKMGENIGGSIEAFKQGDPVMGALGLLQGATSFGDPLRGVAKEFGAPETMPSWAVPPAMQPGMQNVTPETPVFGGLTNPQELAGLVPETLFDPTDRLVEEGVKRIGPHVGPLLRRGAEAFSDATANIPAADNLATGALRMARGISPDLYEDPARAAATATEVTGAPGIPEPMAAYARVNEGKAAIGIDPRLVNVLGGNLYSGDLGKIAVKEMLQNSVDAVRPLLDAQVAKYGSLEAIPEEALPRIKVYVNPTEKVIQVTDQGMGMTPEQLTKEFLDIGGSAKPEGASGGFGIAKVAILANAEDLVVQSRQVDSAGNFVVSTLRGSGADWANPATGLDFTTKTYTPDEFAALVYDTHPRQEASEGMLHPWLQRSKRTQQLGDPVDRNGVPTSGLTEDERLTAIDAWANQSPAGSIPYRLHDWLLDEYEPYLSYLDDLHSGRYKPPQEGGFKQLEPKDILPGDITHPEPGTTVRVKLKDDVTFDSWQATSWLDTFANTQNTGIPFDIENNYGRADKDFLPGDPSLPDSHPDRWGRQVDKPRTLQARFGEPGHIDIPGANMDVYLGRGTTKTTYAKVQVLNKGLPQFSTNVYLGRELSIPDQIVLDVQALSGPEQPGYPFRPDREGLRAEAAQAVEDYVQRTLAADAIGRENEALKNALNSATRMPGTAGSVVVDTSGNVHPDLVQRIATSDSNAALVRILNNAYGMMSRRTDRLFQTATSTNSEFWGIGLGQEFLAMNVRTSDVFGAGSPNRVLINPFQLFADVFKPFTEGTLDIADATELLANQMASDLVHELTHMQAWGHDEAFASYLTRNNGALVQQIGSTGAQIMDFFRQNPGYLDELRSTQDELAAAWSGGENLFAKIGVSTGTDPRLARGGAAAAATGPGGRGGYAADLQPGLADAGTVQPLRVERGGPGGGLGESPITFSDRGPGRDVGPVRPGEPGDYGPTGATPGGLGGRYYHGTGTPFEGARVPESGGRSYALPGYYGTPDPEQASRWAGMDEIGSMVRPFDIDPDTNLFDARRTLPEGEVRQIVAQMNRVSPGSVPDEAALVQRVMDRQSPPWNGNAISALFTLRGAYPGGTNTTDVLVDALKSMGYHGVRADEGGEIISLFDTGIKKATNALSGLRESGGGFAEQHMAAYKTAGGAGGEAPPGGKLPVDLTPDDDPLPPPESAVQYLDRIVSEMTPGGRAAAAKYGQEVEHRAPWLGNVLSQTEKVPEGDRWEQVLRAANPEADDAGAAVAEAMDAAVDDPYAAPRKLTRREKEDLAGTRKGLGGLGALENLTPEQRKLSEAGIADLSQSPEIRAAHGFRTEQDSRDAAERVMAYILPFAREAKPNEPVNEALLRAGRAAWAQVHWPAYYSAIDYHRMAADPEADKNILANTKQAMDYFDGIRRVLGRYAGEIAPSEAARAFRSMQEVPTGMVPEIAGGSGDVVNRAAKTPREKAYEAMQRTFRQARRGETAGEDASAAGTRRATQRAGGKRPNGPLAAMGLEWDDILRRSGDEDVDRTNLLAGLEELGGYRFRRDRTPQAMALDLSDGKAVDTFWADARKAAGVDKEMRPFVKFDPNIEGQSYLGGADTITRDQALKMVSRELIKDADEATSAYRTAVRNGSPKGTLNDLEARAKSAYERMGLRVEQWNEQSMPVLRKAADSVRSRIEREWPKNRPAGSGLTEEVEKKRQLLGIFDQEIKKEQKLAGIPVTGLQDLMSFGTSNVLMTGRFIQASTLESALSSINEPFQAFLRGNYGRAGRQLAGMGRAFGVPSTGDIAALGEGIKAPAMVNALKGLKDIGPMGAAGELRDVAERGVGHIRSDSPNAWARMLSPMHKVSRGISEAFQTGNYFGEVYDLAHVASETGKLPNGRSIEQIVDETGVTRNPTVKELFGNLPQEIVDEALKRSKAVNEGGDPGRLEKYLGDAKGLLNKPNATSGDRTLGLFANLLFPFVYGLRPMISSGTKTLFSAGYHGADLAKHIKAGDGAEAAYAAKKLVLANSFNAFIAYQVIAGNVTGHGPASPSARQALMEETDDNGDPIWRPDSIRVPNPGGGHTWIKYTSLPGPVSIVATVMGNLHDAYVFDGEDLESGGERALRVIPEVAKGWADNTYFRDMINLVEAFHGTDPATGLGRVAGQVAGRFVPGAGALRTAAIVSDPYQRMAAGPIEDIQSGIPGLREQLPAQVSAYTGKPVEVPMNPLTALGGLSGNVYGSPSERNPVAREAVAASRRDLFTGVRPSEGLASDVFPRTFTRGEQTRGTDFAGSPQTGEGIRGAQAAYGRTSGEAMLRMIESPRYQAADARTRAMMLTQAADQAQQRGEYAAQGAPGITLEPTRQLAREKLQSPRFRGVSGSADQIAEQNQRIAAARNALSELTSRYGRRRAMALLNQADPEALRLARGYKPMNEDLLWRQEQARKARLGLLDTDTDVLIPDFGSGPSTVTGAGLTNRLNRPPSRR